MEEESRTSFVATKRETKGQLWPSKQKFVDGLYRPALHVLSYNSPMIVMFVILP